MASLKQAAQASGADGVIHVTLQHRTSSAAVAVGCGNQAAGVFEVYGIATAVRLGE